MKNSFKIIIFTLSIIFFLISYSFSNEEFNFDITEVEITDEGNQFSGYKRGIIKTNDGITFIADEFNYNKISNIFNARGNVQINDTIKKIIIYSNKATYNKNEGIIFTRGNSKAIDQIENLVILAENFNYNKKLNIINAKKNVEINDENKNSKLFGEDVTYNKNTEEIFSKDKTTIFSKKKYKFISTNVLFNRDKMELSSFDKGRVLDNENNNYEFQNFIYNINEELLKAYNIIVTTNDVHTSDKKDQYFFSDGFFNFKNQNFKATKTEITLHKDIFGNPENDPRLYGVASSKIDNITEIHKGIFTSCKKNDNCPPWSIKAKKIKHDKNKKQLIYDDAILQLYDKPVAYFPKFFHPDPSVVRQSGLLKPQLNNSTILGSSLQMPYFHVLSENKDITLTPNIFDSNILMMQSEYRQANEFSSFIADFAFTKGYQSTSQADNNRNSISHFFSKFDLDLNLEKFEKSKFFMKLEKVTNDTYLKVFDGNLINTLLKPSNKDTLSSSLNITLENENYNFSAGLSAYEKLSGKNSDRYQFVLPHYSFSRNLYSSLNYGSIDFSSSGDNNLKDTNNLRSRVVNDISYASNDYFSNFGIKNNFNLYFKNLNTVAKNDAQYKSSPQVQLSSIFEATSSLPLIKFGENYDEYIVPKISFRINPGDMKNYSSNNRGIDVNNIFSINRLGLSDAFESGKSLTLGIDYKKESIESLTKFFEMKFGVVLRESYEDKIPTSSTINEKTSNIFGSINNSLNDKFKINYNYSIDNDLKSFEYNSLTASLNIDKFYTKLRFIEQNGEIGDSNSIENTLTYQFDDKNFISFNTRRNRKINLTEYYDLLYEYKNDCLTAGIKYFRRYYEDRDLKPSEDYLLTLTIFPLTTIEKSYDRNR